MSRSLVPAARQTGSSSRRPISRRDRKSLRTERKPKAGGGWIEAGSRGGGQPPPIDAFRAAGHGKFENVLSNLYVYFWRWATWKVFDAHDNGSNGIVAFISPSSFTTGARLCGHAEYLRRTADEGWIIDLSPEKFRPDVATRIFAGVQHKLCIAVFARFGAWNRDAPARINYSAVTGDRESKSRQLASLSEAGTERWDAARAGKIPSRRPQDKAGSSFRRSVTSCRGRRPASHRTVIGFTPPTQPLCRSGGVGSSWLPPKTRRGSLKRRTPEEPALRRSLSPAAVPHNSLWARRH